MTVRLREAKPAHHAMLFPTKWRRRWLRIRAVVALVAGSAAVLGCGSGDATTRLDDTQASPPPSARSTSAGPSVTAQGSSSAATRSGKAPSPTAPIRLSLQVMVGTMPGAERMSALRTTVAKRLPDFTIVQTTSDAPRWIGVAATETKGPSLPASAIASRASGLDEKGIEAVAERHGVIGLTVRSDSAKDRAAAQAICEVVADVARELDGIVVDSVAGHFYSAEAFREMRVATWKDGVPDARRHVVVEATQDRGFVRTRGLSSLGVPDLRIPDVSMAEASRATTLLDALAQLLVEGRAIGDDGTSTIAIAPIAHAGAREALGRGAPKAGATKVALRPIATERLDQGHPVLDVTFPESPGKSESERAAAGLAGLLGPVDSITTEVPEGDPELAALAARVQKKLPSIAERFRRGLVPGEQMLVKVPFPMDGGAGTERMWITVTAWKDGVVEGHVDDVPKHVASLTVGSEVKVRQDAITDYAVHGPGAKHEGAESDAILRKRALK